MNQQVKLQGTVATDMRLVITDDKDFPICLLLENPHARRAMSGGMTPQQAYELGTEMINVAKRFGVHNG
jgi:hypothetical protein